MDNDYTNSFLYERFILNARKINDENKFDAHRGNMQSLMDAEAGKFKMPGYSHNRILKNVKKYMTSATKAAIKIRMNKADKEIVKSYLPAIDEATTSVELLAICKAGIEILLKYKDNS